MIGVDIIGQIRRAYFEQQRPIKEIVRTLSVSRATVRKVIRGQATEFKYERGVQPVPKLGEWVTVLTEILAKEAKLPRRERRSTQRLFEELRGLRLARSCWKTAARIAGMAMAENRFSPRPPRSSRRRLPSVWGRFPVGARPTRRSSRKQPGAGMEATKCLKPPDSGHDFGDRASGQAAT